MNINQFIILISGTVAVAATGWFFFAKKEDVEEAFGSSVSIKVDAGYSPSTIVIKKGQPVTLNIERIDASNCLEEIILPEWGIKKYLPVNKEISINLEPKKEGEYPFHCGMNMFHGKIIVEKKA